MRRHRGFARRFDSAQVQLTLGDGGFQLGEQTDLLVWLVL
jgi:hypothetical protein